MFQMMQKIYVLQCESNKYYVGKTSNIDRRFAEHLSGEYGSEWTKYYRPQEIIEVQDMVGNFDEMNKTLEYMKRFGIDDVRGAQWSNVNLTSEQRDAIMAAMNTDACFLCGQKGHFSNNCPSRNQLFQSPQRIQCFKCGKYGHFANVCYSNQNRMRCNRCGRDSHDENNCYAKTDVDGEMLDCARCGRDSHSADKCYAKSDIDGRRLY
jgi:cellular nucleic acid-binding protein